jgi:hypothetical protein
MDKKLEFLRQDRQRGPLLNIWRQFGVVFTKLFGIPMAANGNFFYFLFHSARLRPLLYL